MQRKYKESLSTDTKLHIFSFLSEHNIDIFSCVNKEYYQLANEIWKNKLNQEFHFYNKDTVNPRSIYKRIMYEKKLYIKFIENCFNPPENSHFDFSKNNIAYVLFDCSSKKDRNQLELEVEIISVINEYNLLFKSPDKIEKHRLSCLLSVLCRSDAYLTLDVTCKNKSLEIKELWRLISLAIESVNINSLRVLLSLKFDITQYVHYVEDKDNKCQLYCSPLYYALSFISCPNTLMIKCGERVKFDNIVFWEIVDLLLEKGANPEQNCLLVFNNSDSEETASKEIMPNENCQKLAQEILSDFSIKNYQLRH